jgi:hypothetical protein
MKKITGKPPRIALEDVPEDQMIIVMAGRKGNDVYMTHAMGPTVPLMHSGKMRGALILTLTANFLSHMAALHETHIDGPTDVPTLDVDAVVDQAFPKSDILDADGKRIH